jgi:hypothetical protein
MVFAADINHLGVPEFGIVHIDAEQTAQAFQTYLETGSKLTGVSLDDISVRVAVMPANPERTNLAELLRSGMHLFDAMIWLHAGRPDTKPLTLDPTYAQESIPSLKSVANAVFYNFFMLLTQARYAPGRRLENPPRMPQFLTTIMGMDEPPHMYVERICSFDIQKFDPRWIRYVHFGNMGQETLSRFGLGVAGYRSFAPFGLYEPRAGVSARLLDSVAFARTIARSPATWGIHPVTRHPNVLTARGNLNKNLANLMLDVFTREQLDEMVTSKLLYAMPTREPSHRNYLTWAAADDISGNNAIFPAA